MNLMSPLDSRLVSAGSYLTIPLLVTLWGDHTPALLPVPLSCPTCRHRYSAESPLCPTAAVVRPILRRRRYEGSRLQPGYRTANPALTALTPNQLQDLTGTRLSTALPAEKRTR